MTATARLAPSIALTVIARVWSAGMALVFTPVLLRVLSPEGFGVVSFGVSLQAAFTIIDTALTTTLTRDLARARTRRDVNVAEILRTLEVVYWSAACLFAVVLLALAAPIAKSWFEPATLPQQEISRGLTVMALAFAAQWPLTFYLGGLLASERVIAYTSLVILSSTFRYGGAAVWISQVSPTLTGFFAFQAVSGLAASTVAARLLWKALPNAGKPRVSLDTLRD